MLKTRSEIEKNKEKLCDEIEKLGNIEISDPIAERLSAYIGAYKALCMINPEKAGPAKSYAQNVRIAKERPAPTPELDGDTEFERLIMSIPQDRAHMVRITYVFNRHLEGLKIVNSRAYNSIMEQLKEIAKS